MSTPDNIRHYLIPQIGSWQLAANENEVSLPALQRGFVWDAGRIESLWDSLLRGFPIGSFLLASNRSGKYQLLDGQQRSTAIAIGMFNPWLNPEVHFWRIRGCPVLWLDINSENREHRFKIISHAHPWGYDKQSERLNATERKRAYDAIFQQIAEGFSGKYYELPLSKSWPWVASAPFPFSFLFEDDVDLSDLTCAKEAMLNKCVARLKHISALVGRKGAADYRKAIDLFWGKDNIASSQLLEHACRLTKSAVPAIIIPEGILSSTGPTTRWGDDTSNQSTEEKEGLEIIFERINSGGVVLGGEELVYSIFKSLLPAASEIEKECDYIKPAKVMHYAVRLVMASNRRSSSVFPKRVKIREFKEWLEKDDNQDEVARLISNLDKDDSPFRLARNIMTGEPGARQPWHLSFYQTSAIANESADPFFLLLFRLRKGDRFESASSQRKALGFITSLCWFVERSGRGTAKACENIWQHRSASQKDFWAGETLKSAVKYNTLDSAFFLIPPCPPGDLEKLFKKLQNDRLNWNDLGDVGRVTEFFKAQRFYYFYREHFGESTNVEGDAEDDDITPTTIPKLAMVRFVNQLRESEGLLAYACRAAICDWFDDYFRTSLEDTDRPWDRDHIYPAELTKSKRVRYKSELGLNLVKDWQSTVANLRLWPLELNRSDSNQLPSYKFDFVNNRDSLQSHGIKAPEDLFRRSAIDPAESELWLDLGDNPKEKAQAQDILNAFLKRLTFIYRDWYESLGIAELFPDGRLGG